MLLHRNEPILRDGKVVGFVTSGAFAYEQGASVGLCFMSPPASAIGRSTLEGGDYAVMVEGQKIAAHLSLKPFSLPQTSG